MYKRTHPSWQSIYFPFSSIINYNSEKKNLSTWQDTPGKWYLLKIQKLSDDMQLKKVYWARKDINGNTQANVFIKVLRVLEMTCNRRKKGQIRFKQWTESTNLLRHVFKNEILKTFLSSIGFKTFIRCTTIVSNYSMKKHVKFSFITNTRETWMGTSRKAETKQDIHRSL